MPKTTPWMTMTLLGLLVTGCGELGRLRDENLSLKAEIEALKKSAGSHIAEFTIGVVAADEGFDESAFRQLITESLESASSDASTLQITTESNEQQIAKIRALLVQQYFRERKVPIEISNLTYKVEDARDEFTIGGATIPLKDVVVERDDGTLVRCTYAEGVNASMSRQSDGAYAVEFASSSGMSGEVGIEVDDSQLYRANADPQIARHGDISFNWQPRLERILVYHVTDFQGDVGRFLQSMRYPKSRIELNQYQSMRDSLLLFGYGPYATGLLDRLETPPYIDKVEVLAISEEVFQRLEPGLPREDLEALLAGLEGEWVACDQADETPGANPGEGKIWERPVAVRVPFLSRQSSSEKKSTFYTKYGVDGPNLIGDFPTR